MVWAAPFFGGRLLVSQRRPPEVFQRLFPPFRLRLFPGLFPGLFPRLLPGVVGFLLGFCPARRNRFPVFVPDRFDMGLAPFDVVDSYEIQRWGPYFPSHLAVFRHPLPDENLLAFVIGPAGLFDYRHVPLTNTDFFHLLVPLS